MAAPRKTATSKARPAPPESDLPTGQVTESDVDRVTRETTEPVDVPGPDEGVTEVRRSTVDGPVDQVPLPLLEEGDKPYPSADPVLDADANRELIGRTGLTQIRADLPEGRDLKRDDQCVVEACQWRRMPGAKICSGHEIHYFQDGTPRGKIIETTEGNAAHPRYRVEANAHTGSLGYVAGAVGAAHTLAHPKVVAPAAEHGDLVEPGTEEE